ncbi:MAG: YdjY domain-containing protein [Thermodesulfobacteriota bacterium]|nr:YdjY domain-containing protein [Thermodesulfobacteriota bacterium]
MEPVAASPASRRKKPPIEKVAENTYRIGGVTVDTKERLVTCPARVNLREGVLEVLICTEYGKTHESLLSTKVNPLHLNVAFLLLGLEGGHAVKYQGDPTKPVGSPVEIWFKLKEGDKEKSVRAEDWVYNNHTNRPMLHTPWVYVGSVLTEDGFMAQREGQIATTFHDPFTLIDNPLPGGGDDTVYVPNTKQLPPLGTELTVVIKCGPVRRWDRPLPGTSR